MILKKWEELPKEFQTPEVKEYYDILSRKRSQLVLKRLFDVVVSVISDSVILTLKAGSIAS